MDRAAVEAVCKSNATRRSRAVKLNARAGEPLFNEFDRDTLVAFLLAQLRGARTIADIESVGVEALRLPTLDEELAAQVDRAHPDSMEVLGQSCTIHYCDSAPPWVELTGALENTAFLGLPDDGVSLPDGRTVEVRLNRERRDALADTDIPKLKAKAAEHLKEQRWNDWAFKNRQGKPTILLPDPGKEKEEIAPVLEVEYGRCCLSGAPFIAYGVVCAQLEEDPYFTGRWVRYEAEAREVREVAVQKLDSIKEEAQAQRRAEQNRKEAEELFASLGRLISLLDERDPGSSSLKKQLARLRRTIPNGPEGAPWLAEATDVISQAEAHLAHLREAAITRFEGYFNRLKGGNNADHWVIGFDGVLRDPNEITLTREGAAEGNKTWYCVGPGDVAISWYGGTSFELAHVPADGSNPNQRETIRRIETEDLRLQAGFFGLDPEIRRYQRAVEEAVALAVRACPACEKPLDTSGRYWDLVGDHGIGHCAQEVVIRFVRNFRPGKPSDRRCSGKDATVFRKIPTPHGDVEMVVYTKHGTENVAFRLALVNPEASLEPSPERVPEPPQERAPETTSLPEPVSVPLVADGLSLLLSRFGPDSSLGSVGRVRDRKKGGGG